MYPRSSCVCASADSRPGRQWWAHWIRPACDDCWSRASDADRERDAEVGDSSWDIEQTAVTWR